MLILIDTKNLRMIAAAENRNHIHLIAWIDFPELGEDFTVVDSEEKRTWSIISGPDMETLYRNMSGEEPPNYSACIQELAEYAQSWEPYEKSEAVLQREYDKRPLDTSKPVKSGPVHHSYTDLHGGQEAAPARRISADDAKPKREPKAGGEAPSAPRKAGATKDVWDVADAVFAELGNLEVKKLRTAIIEACAAKGINPGTAATQYGKWKASKGL